MALVASKLRLGAFVASLGMLAADCAGKPAPTFDRDRIGADAPSKIATYAAMRSPLRAASQSEAPSVTALHADDDARDLAALDDCSWRSPYLTMMEREQPNAARCGLPPFTRDVDLGRLASDAMALDDATVAHVRAIFAAGRARARRVDTFGVVGDSISVDRSFLRPFGDADNPFVVLSPAVKDVLKIDGERTVLDVFRASFDTERAARVGAKASWAIAKGPDGKSAVDRMIESLSPAYALVMFGTNDAVEVLAPPEQIARDFLERLGAVVTAIEEAGVIPILSTIPKHMRDKRFADCPVKGTLKSNYRFAIQTNAVSAAVVDLAAERHLPLVDLRDALDPLLDHGVGKDGVHPTRFYRGGGILDEQGLQCGYNVRNFVSLVTLKRVREAVLQ